MDDLRTLLSEYDVPAAFWVTIKLTVLSAIGALIIGTFVAVMRVSPIAVLRSFGTAYVTVVRNTPLTLIVFFCAFGLYNNLGLRLAPAQLADLHRRQQLPVRGRRARRLPRRLRRRGHP